MIHFVVYIYFEIKKKIREGNVKGKVKIIFSSFVVSSLCMRASSRYNIPSTMMRCDAIHSIQYVVLTNIAIRNPGPVIPLNVCSLSDTNGIEN
jgi:hypothetical protein